MNETNASGPTDGEQILWNQLAERDEVNAQLRAEVERLTKERDEAMGILSQLNSDYEKQSPMSRPPLAAQVDYIASVVSERDSLKTQLAEREEDRLPDIEVVSNRVHSAWVDSKRAAGVTSRLSESGEELMVPYDKLSSAAKELDRSTVRAVYAAIRAARAQPEDGK